MVVQRAVIMVAKMVEPKAEMRVAWSAKKVDDMKAEQKASSLVVQMAELTVESLVAW